MSSVSGQSQSAPHARDSVSEREIQETTNAKSQHGSMKSGPQSHASSSAALNNMWQHPFVDVFKHFKILPVADWKANKKQGDVSEVFAKEIGRKAMHLNGTISANNFIQIPNPNTNVRNLGLTGRYLYLQVKVPVQSTPLSFHVDLQMAERSHGIRISASNLYKQVSTQNGFVMQLPLNLDVNRWTVVVFDLYSLLKYSELLPSTYLIEGSYVIKSLTLCANSVVRGVYTSDNLYDFVTLPMDMRFKFSFEISRWPENFAWLELPQDLNEGASERQLAEDRTQQLRAKAALRAHNQQSQLNDKERVRMQQEIDGLLMHKQLQTEEKREEIQLTDKEAKYRAIQEELAAKFGGSKQGYGADDLLTADDHLGLTGKPMVNEREGMRYEVQGYTSGQYCGAELRRAHKLQQDPIMELSHIIGYSPERCLSLMWSKLPNERTVVFTSGGTLIAMDVETKHQKRFFFGHSAPVCCFDIAAHGGMMASAQEGKNSLIRIWDYHTARCLSILTMPVQSLKCVSFSPDGRYLACVGKDSHNKEMVVVWDVSRIHRGEKPEIAAKQTSDFNILCLKFSPIDNYRLVSCGKENIRFWRIRETGNIRGSAVVLNQHSRNTVFTALDFEWGARAANIASGASLNPDSKENDSLKRVYVGSKHGMVFQVNYLTEQLEATYRTNDGPIYSISVNEAFCVTGSEDMNLRIWPLDFSEFYLQCKHDGVVCSVDISQDGLQVICGSLNGLLGLVDKTNNGYTTLTRAHTDSILCMAFSLPKHNIISVGKDKTIRIWDLVKYSQIYEFTCGDNDPLCVAAHPSLPIFACGFHTGSLRIFDIDKMCVAEEFTQFNKPLQALAYSPNGELLATCCIDGSVALHDARRQHLPTKMMHLEFPPQFVHTAFTPLFEHSYQKVVHQNSFAFKVDQNLSNFDMSQDEMSQGSRSNTEQSSAFDVPHDGRPNEQLVETVKIWMALFGVMGEYGNNLMIYDTESIMLKHQIQVGHIIRSFQFTRDARNLLVTTKDQRIKFYSLNNFEGQFLRELTTVHRGNVLSIDLSLNGGYLLTGGEDNLVKVWDYEAQKTAPYYYQAFIGHTYPVNQVLFNPTNNKMIFSIGEKDGIYVWQFAGDTQTNYLPYEAPSERQEQPLNRDALHEPTVLERMRRAVKDKKKPKLAEFSFIVPDFTPHNQEEKNLMSLGVILAKQDGESVAQCYERLQVENDLPVKHFVGLQDVYNPELTLDKKTAVKKEGDAFIAHPTIVNGYDGFAGVHDNLQWNPSKGSVIYTLNNKVIFEDSKTRYQKVYVNSTVRLSCLAVSEDFKHLAVGEGEPTENEGAKVLVYQIVEKGRGSSASGNELQFVRYLMGHQKGIQSLAFANQDKLLISVGVHNDGILCIFNAKNSQHYRSLRHLNGIVNQIIPVPGPPRTLDTDVSTEIVNFWTIGNKGHLLKWEFHDDGNSEAVQQEMLFEPQQVELPPDLQEADFVTAAFTPRMELYNGIIMLVGCKDGRMLAVDPYDACLEPKSETKQVSLNEITSISVKNQHIVFADSNGTLARYRTGLFSDSTWYPPEEDPDSIAYLKQEDGAITSLALDQQNEEGICGTSKGSIYYFSFKDKEKVIIRLISRVAPCIDSPQHIKFDPQNPLLFLTSCGTNSGDIKLFTSTMIDQVMVFGQSKERKEMQYGPVRFVVPLLQKSKSQKFLVGYFKGTIKIIIIDKLQDQPFLQLPLEADEELTCAACNPGGHNVCIGTTFGNMFIISLTSRNGNQADRKYVKITRISNTTENAVTSIQMTTFNPDGSLLVAFDNGQVRVWQSVLSEEQRTKIEDYYKARLQLQDDTGKKATKKDLRKSRVPIDIAQVQGMKFDVIDKFDMFENPHNLEEVTEEQAANYRELYGGKKYMDCEAQFVKSKSVGLYVCYVSALQVLFIRDYMYRSVRSVPLMNFPQRLSTFEVSSEIGSYLRRGDLMACVGTQSGQVLIYKIDPSEQKLIVKTESGLFYGQIAGLTTQENGQEMIVTSSAGELVKYDLAENFYLAGQQEQQLKK